MRRRALLTALASFKGGRSFAVVSSAVRNDLDVFVYVKDVLDRLLSGETDYEALRPDIWKRTHPEALREYHADVKKAHRPPRRASRR